MHSPYRIPTPPTPEGPDHADVYEAALRARAGRARRYVIAACGAIAGLSLMALAERPPAHPPSMPRSMTRSATQIGLARDAIRDARQTAAREQNAFQQAVRSTPLSTEKRSEPCPVVLREASHLVHGRQAFPLLVVEENEPIHPSTSVSALLGEVNRAAEDLDRGRFLDGILEANALGERAHEVLRYEVIVVARILQHPMRTTNASFEPGRVAGRAYLYDFEQRRIRCAGDVDVSSSPQIEYSYVAGETSPAAQDQGPSLTAFLDADLEIRLQRALARGSLFVVP